MARILRFAAPTKVPTYAEYNATDNHIAARTHARVSQGYTPKQPIRWGQMVTYAFTYAMLLAALYTVLAAQMGWL